MEERMQRIIFRVLRISPVFLGRSQGHRCSHENDPATSIPHLGRTGLALQYEGGKAL